MNTLAIFELNYFVLVFRPNSLGGFDILAMSDFKRG